MIIFLYGPDTYRSRQKLNEIVEHYKEVHKSGLNLKYFDGKKISYQDFKDQFWQTSMFNEKKLVVFKNTFLNQEFKKIFLENSKKFINSSDTTLFYEEEEVLPNDPLFEFLVKNAKVQEFKLLERQQLKNWIKKELEKYRAKAEPQAIEKLVIFVGNDLWQLSNEIKKLIVFKKDKRIEGKDIELLVKPKIETDIFKTIDAIAAKDKKRALSLIHKHLEGGDSHLYLLHMINFQFRSLLIIRDLIDKNKSYNTVLKKSRLHPYVFRKNYWQAKKFSIQELKKIYQKLFEVDLAIKTGRLEPNVALDMLIAGL